MRPSRYNVLAPAYGGGSILYNTANQACALLDDDETALYRALGEDGAAGVAGIEAAGLEEGLASMGLLVEDPRDELDFMRYEFEKYKFNDRVFELYICPTLDCNLNCIYCYEHKRKGKMSTQTADSVFAYIGEQYANQPFKELKIVWYGGEPLLGMDIIEYLSAKILPFVDEHGLEYYASIITNGVLATEEVQQRLKELRVWCVMATLDGEGCMHDRTRPARNGQPTYDTIMENVEGFLDKGFKIDFRCVVDCENCSSCMDLAGKFAQRDNINVSFNQMRNLTDFEENDPRADVVDIMTPEAHGKAVLEEFLRRNPSSKDFEHWLRPLLVSCSAEIDRAYTIDELGNAYKCTSMPGMDEFVLFNVCEPPEKRKINQRLIARYGNANPLNDERCANCRVYPLCRGGCSRTRVEDSEMTCIPFKYMIEDALTAYSRTLSD